MVAEVTEIKVCDDCVSFCCCDAGSVFNPILFVQKGRFDWAGCKMMGCVTSFAVANQAFCIKWIGFYDKCVINTCVIHAS